MMNANTVDARWMMRIDVGAAVFVALAATPLGAQQVVDLPARDRTLAADFEEVYRVGSIDGELWETFGEIGGTAFDAVGNLYVFDRQAGRVVVVDRDGALVREIGEPGEGPGELRMPVGFTVMPDGLVVIADIGHRAYQIFDREGSFERMVSMSADGATIRMGELAPHPSGEAVISVGGNAVAIGPGGGEPEEPDTRPIEVLDLSDDVVGARTLADAWLPPRGDPITLEGDGLRFQTATAGPRTFEPALLIGTLPDGGIVYSDSTAYALKVTGPDGTVTGVLRRPIRPRRVTERMKEAERERRLQELSEGGGPRLRLMVGDGGGAPRPVPQEQIRQMLEDQIAQMQFYDELPVVQDLATSWTGTVWVERRGEQPTGPGPIDLLETDGRYVGSFAAGATDIPDAFGPDRLAAYVELDELDVPTVVVRRLPAEMN